MKEKKKTWRFYKSFRGQPTVVWDEKKKKPLARLPARPGDAPFVTTSEKLAKQLQSLGYSEHEFTYDDYLASEKAMQARQLHRGSMATDSPLPPPKEVDLDKIPAEAAVLLQNG